jgi:hypothetical protein
VQSLERGKNFIEIGLNGKTQFETAVREGLLDNRVPIGEMPQIDGESFFRV